VIVISLFQICKVIVPALELIVPETDCSWSRNTNNMDTKVSLNAFSQPSIQVGKDRKRLYSWSRPSKHRLRKPMGQTEMTIKGKATLAFSADGSWFQGNIISATEDAYTITGRRTSHPAMLNLAISSHGKLNPITEHGGSYSLSSSGSSYSHTSLTTTSFTSSPVNCLPHQAMLDSSDCGDQPSPSDIDSLDSELVRVALENFSLEEDDSDVLYDVAIMDYETGMNHSVKAVECQVSEDIIKLMGDTLIFQAETCSKGAKADMVIHKNIGQALTDKNMIVFQGSLQYTYSDMVCFPIPQEEGQGQWCL